MQSMRFEELTRRGLVITVDELSQHKQEPYRIFVVHFGCGYRNVEYWAVRDEAVKVIDLDLRDSGNCALENGHMIYSMDGPVSEMLLRECFSFPFEHVWIGMDK